MKWKRILGGLLLVAGLFVSVSLFSGLEISRARAQSGEGSSPKGIGKEFTDIMNWSWNLSAFGYLGSVSVTLKKEVKKQRSGKVGELAL
jgi:hypothetical protein